MQKKNLIAMTVLCTMAAGYAEKPQSTEQQTKKETFPAIELGNMDTTINPADDFFRYCNNNWMTNNPIPEEYSTFGAFTEIGQRNEKLIQAIIDEVSADANAAQGSVAQKIRDFYNAGMDTVAINKRGYTELMPYFEQIEKLNDKAGLATLLGELHKNGTSGFFSPFPSADPKNAEMMIMHLYQGGLSLTDRDDYLKKETQEMRDKYVEHVAKMFELTGTEAEAAADKAKRILAFETELAKNSMSRVERRDPDKTYNMRTLVELQNATPNFDWTTYFKAIGAPTIESLNVGMPNYITALDKIIGKADLETIKDYLRWKLIHGSALMLSSDLDAENFSFYGNYLYGQQAQQPRWRRILDATSDCLGEAIGQLYVEKHFPAEAKARMMELVSNLRVALGERIKNLEWMSDETKAKALTKLAAFNVKIGYPDKWKDYGKYEVTPESYFANVQRAIRFETERSLAKIGKPVDKDEWFMTPQTVNAYYSPEMNEIVFPAAILQPPFFNMDADDAVNYGGIGVVIGHEMTHGFDDQGCKYDEKGNLNNWWTEEDSKKFNERTAQLAKLFNEFNVRGYQINGQLTLGENIADLGGLNVAWDAFQLTNQAKENKNIDGYTPAQRFFISYGTIWRNNSRDKYLERQVITDVHSPAEARVNRTLGSMPHFYEAFEIPEGSKMYIAPEERANIW